MIPLHNLCKLSILLNLGKSYTLEHTQKCYHICLSKSLLLPGPTLWFANNDLKFVLICFEYNVDRLGQIAELAAMWTIFYLKFVVSFLPVAYAEVQAT